MEILKQIESKNKAIKVINSCVTDEQFNSALNYIELYYKRFEDYQPVLKDMQISDFRSKWIDSVFINPLSGNPFIIEIISLRGRKSFNIKPSNDEKVIKDVGAIIEGEITWDEKENKSL